MDVAKIEHESANTLAEKFLNCTKWQQGTWTKGAFDTLYIVNKKGIKKDIEKALSDTFEKRGQKPETVTEIIDEEMSGVNRKWALAIYQGKDPSKEKVSMMDHILGQAENTLDEIVNNPIESALALGAGLGILYSKLSLPLKILGVLVVPSVFGYISSKISKKFGMNRKDPVPMIPLDTRYNPDNKQKISLNV